MKIYLARHGQSQWQVEQDENWNTSLTAIGHEQARRMGQWLANHRMVDSRSRVEIASICTSPYKRAQETAVYIAEALHLPLFTRQDLREADFHVVEHLPQAVTPLQLQPVHEPSAIYIAFKSQAQAALQGLLEQIDISRGPVIAVTHGGLIKTMLRLVIGSDTICFRIYNTGLSLIEWKHGRWHLIHLNLWDHLSKELRTW